MAAALWAKCSLQSMPAASRPAVVIHADSALAIQVATGGAAARTHLQLQALVSAAHVKPHVGHPWNEL
eukprot:6761796-Alexandrium_andersonii.AAC.1